MSKDVIEDFGFSFEDEEEIVSSGNKDLEDELEQVYEANNEILKRVDVLLNNLKKNPEKEMIRWANRVKDIEKFQESLRKLNMEK